MHGFFIFLTKKVHNHEPLKYHYISVKEDAVKPDGYFYRSLAETL